VLVIELTNNNGVFFSRNKILLILIIYYCLTKTKTSKLVYIQETRIDQLLLVVSN